MYNITLEKTNNQINALVNKTKVGYVRYNNNLNRYWAPAIFINYIEVFDYNYRRLGIGTLLINEVKSLFPNEVILLEIMEDSETRVEHLREFYSKLNFKEILDTGHSYIYAYEPKGKSVKDFNKVPEDILYEAMLDYSVIEKYNLYDLYVDDLSMSYEEDYGNENFEEYYKDIEDSVVLELLTYY